MPCSHSPTAIAIKFASHSKQQEECIPVGCVLPAHRPYLVVSHACPPQPHTPPATTHAPPQPCTPPTTTHTPPQPCTPPATTHAPPQPCMPPKPCTPPQPCMPAPATMHTPLTTMHALRNHARPPPPP